MHVKFEPIGIIIRNMHVKFESIGRVKIFHEKMPTVLGMEILWKFQTFSKFTKFHQTYRIYWNHHLKHACEILVHREVKIFHEKVPTVPAIEILWKFHTFSKFTKSHQTCRIYWNHHLKRAGEILVHFGEVKIFMKMLTELAIEIYCTTLLTQN